MAFVVILHLDPNRESMLGTVISRWTEMQVIVAKEGQSVLQNKIYVIPPDTVMTIGGGRLHVRRRTSPKDTLTVDTFLASLARDQGENAVCIVLSGTGADGSIGIKAIKEYGGLTFSQGSDGTEARFKEMPANAAATGLVDLVLPVQDMPRRLIDFANRQLELDERHKASGERPSPALRTLYTLLRTRLGHDFSRYKDRTFLRRVQRRMQVLQVSSLDDYTERLKADTNEAGQLFRDLLIGVTNFFRDRDAFTALETHLPRLFEGKGADEFVRVWVTGCATGEEAYSLAMVLREHADATASAPKIQIFATDIDENALAIARTGIYPESVLSDVPPARLKRFFFREGTSYRVVKEIRDLCVFSSHSLIRDPPFSRLDLISCRNLLIYLNTDLQTQVIPLFHYALRPGGILFLGTSENVSRHGDLFSALDKRWRVFERLNLVTRPEMPFPMLARSAGGLRADRGPTFYPISGAGESGPTLQMVLRQIATTVQEHYGPGYVVANKAGEVVYYSGRTGKYLEAAEGPPNRDLVSMARKGLRLDLRAALHRARESGETVAHERLSVQIDGGSQLIKLVVQPVSDSGETLYLIVFTDLGQITHRDDSEDEPGKDDRDNTVQQLERELQLTRERLQTTVEEFDTSSEELKSSNEELLSVNEELQSANEELETSKEEIQSINEELQTVNAEISNKVEELDRANVDLKNLFESTQVATIMLDNNLTIRSFTPAVGAIFNLIPSDRGRPLTDIVSRLDQPNLERDIRTVISRGEVIEKRATSDGGKVHYLMRIIPFRTSDNKIKGALVTFVDISNVTQAEEHEKILVSELNHRVKNVLDSVISIVGNTLKRSDSLETFSQNAPDRLAALARTHDIVSRHNWTSVPIRDLMLAELAPYVRGAARKNVTLKGGDVSLVSHAALAIGAAIHELVRRAAKVGSLSTPGGSLSIRWAVGNTAFESMLELRWIEKNGKAETAKKAKAPSPDFNIDLINQRLRTETGGEAQVENTRTGFRCTIMLPAARNTIPAQIRPRRSQKRGQLKVTRRGRR
jgi:two-component system CheB/CheR fusion protein